MPSIRGNPARGPDSLVTTTNAAGLANSDAAPTIVVPTMARQSTDAHRADINVLILIALKTISRQLAEGFGLADDTEALMNDEDLGLGPDTNS